jgi:hypothetical protein
VDGGNRWLVAPNGERNWVENVRAGGRIELSRAGMNEKVHVNEVSVLLCEHG